MVRRCSRLLVLHVVHVPDAHCPLCFFRKIRPGRHEPRRREVEGPTLPPHPRELRGVRWQRRLRSSGRLELLPDRLPPRGRAQARAHVPARVARVRRRRPRHARARLPRGHVLGDVRDRPRSRRRVRRFGERPRLDRLRRDDLVDRRFPDAAGIRARAGRLRLREEVPRRQDGRADREHEAQGDHPLPGGHARLLRRRDAVGPVRQGIPLLLSDVREIEI